MAHTCGPVEPAALLTLLEVGGLDFEKIKEYEEWGLKVNLDQIFYMGCGIETEDLILEDQKL